MNICKCELISIKLGENPIEDLELLKYLDKENIPYKFDDKEENLLLNFNINTKNFLTKFWEKLISPLESKGKITCFVNLKNNSYYDFKEKDNYYDFKEKIVKNPSYLIFLKKYTYSNQVKTFLNNFMKEDANELFKLYQASVDLNHASGFLGFKNNNEYKASKNGYKPSDNNPWKKFKIK